MTNERLFLSQADDEADEEFANPISFERMEKLRKKVEKLCKKFGVKYSAPVNIRGEQNFVIHSSYKHDECIMKLDRKAAEKEANELLNDFEFSTREFGSRYDELRDKIVYNLIKNRI